MPLGGLVQKTTIVGFFGCLGSRCIISGSMVVSCGGHLGD